MENNDFRTLLQAKRQREAEKQTKYKKDSRERLGKIATTKIKTTMIGALDAIEKQFGFLWAEDDEGVLTEEAKFMRETYEKVREAILDNGNNQIRNLIAELEHYDIEWLRYHMQLPVRRLPGTQGENNDQK